MTAPHAFTEHSERFRRVIARRLGLEFEDQKLPFLAEVLARRTSRLGRPLGSYVAALETDQIVGELGALAEELTVPETYFFRNGDQLGAFVAVTLPERMKARRHTRALRFLSAGCATGDEPLTLAMLALETITEPGWDVSIRAIDVNPAALRRAESGRFTNWSLRETSPERRRRWFRTDGNEVIVDPAARDMVRFERRNLHDENADLFTAESYDAVFCRNVLMYFTRDSAKAIVARIARSLAIGGHLFLGHAETLRGLSNEFHLHHTHGAFYYEKRLPGRAATFGAAQNGDRDRSPPAGEARSPDDTWVETIRKASARIERLSQPSETSAVEPEAESRTDLRRALELLGKERYVEALALVDDAPLDRVTDADVLLLRAALLAQSGDLPTADAVARRLLEVDELSAAAHYVVALCREGARDHEGAVEHYQLAVYLDPTFAMPRLHLGLLAKRTGDIAAATREMKQALALLEREEASRLLLFGGGFGREALSSLCRSELRSLGGTP